MTLSLLVPLRTSVENEDHLFVTIVCEYCGHEIKVPVYCGNRFCTVCSVPRLARVRRRLSWLVKQVKIRNNYGIKHLTLTIANQPDLPIMLRHLVASFRRLRQRAVWHRHVLGGAYVLEITGRPGNWHAHIHCVIHARYFPFEKLLTLWLKCSGSRGVYIQRIPLRQVVNYLSKYLSKPSVPSPVLRETAEALRGFRLFHPFGDWFNLMKGYVDQKPGCPECKHHSWYPLDLVYGTYIHTYSRASPVNA